MWGKTHGCPKAVVRATDGLSFVCFSCMSSDSLSCGGARLWCCKQSSGFAVVMVASHHHSQDAFTSPTQTPHSSLLGSDSPVLFFTSVRSVSKRPHCFHNLETGPDRFGYFFRYLCGEVLHATALPHRCLASSVCRLVCMHRLSACIFP